MQSEKSELGVSRYKIDSILVLSLKNFAYIYHSIILTYTAPLVILALHGNMYQFRIFLFIVFTMQVLVTGIILKYYITEYCEGLERSIFIIELFVICTITLLLSVPILYLLDSIRVTINILGLFIGLLLLIFESLSIVAILTISRNFERYEQEVNIYVIAKLIKAMQHINEMINIQEIVKFISKSREEAYSELYNQVKKVLEPSIQAYIVTNIATLVVIIVFLARLFYVFC